MPGVSIDWQSDPSKVIDAMKKIAAENITLRGKLQELARDGAKAHKEHQGGLGDEIRDYGRVAASYLTLHKLAETYNEDLERQVELSKEALEFQKSKAANRVQLRNALPAMDAAGEADVDERVKRLREQTGSSNAGNLAAAAVSEGAGLSLDQQFAAARVAGQLNPGEANEGAAQAMAASIAKFLGLGGAKSAEGAAGRLSSLSSMANVPAQDVAEKIVPAAETAVQFGESFEQAAAAMAAFTARFGNTRKGTTAYEALAKGLSDFKPTSKMAGGTLARLDALAADPALLRKFERSDAGKGLTPEAKAALHEYAAGPLAEKVRGAGLPSEEDAAAQTKQRIENLHASGAQQIADLSTRGKQIIGGLKDDEGKALAGEAENRLNDLITENPSFFGRTEMRLERFARSFFQSKPEAFEAMADKAARFNDVDFLSEEHQKYGEAAAKLRDDYQAEAGGRGVARGAPTTEEIERATAGAGGDPFGDELVAETRRTNELLAEQNELLRRNGGRGREGAIVNNGER